MMYPPNKPPTANNYNLCWEPTLAEGRLLLKQVKRLYAEGNQGTILTDGEGVEAFIAHIEKEIECVESDFERDTAIYLERKTTRELRIVNEEQLQEAVKFLTAVWQGEITDATMEQVAAARCFMRAE